MTFSMIRFLVNMTTIHGATTHKYYYLVFHQGHNLDDEDLFFPLLYHLHEPPMLW